MNPQCPPIVVVARTTITVATQKRAARFVPGLLLAALALTSAPVRAQDQACCFGAGLGFCAITSPGICVGQLSGVPQGAGTGCTPSPCRAEVACCFVGSCADRPLQECINAGGLPGPTGSYCYIHDCPLPLLACCLPGNTCQALTGPDCFNAGGIDGPQGSTCENLDCSDLTGACCLANSCQNLTAQQCDAIGGAFYGMQTRCASWACSYNGACCLAGGGCQIMRPNECAAIGGVFTTVTAPCDGICNEPTSPCDGAKRGDANCDGLINNFDIDYFVIAILNASSSSAPADWTTLGGSQACWDQRRCWGDGTCDGALNNFDIDPFVDCILNHSGQPICGVCPLRACCLPVTHNCIMASPAVCLSLGGNPGPANSTCWTLNCP